MDRHRCPWADITKPDYVTYHDEEWGVPVHDDRMWFEFLVLESAQAGLSWYTILKKRDNYRNAFAGFDPEKVARFTQDKIDVLVRDAGIIRNRRKIESAVHNARCFLDVRERFGTFDRFMWQFVDGRPIVHDIRTMSECPTRSPESEWMSKEMKQRGFQFIGPTICYALMQATGLINDHLVSCFRRQEIISTYDMRV